MVPALSSHEPRDFRKLFYERKGELTERRLK